MSQVGPPRDCISEKMTLTEWVRRDLSSSDCYGGPREGVIAWARMTTHQMKDERACAW